MVLDRNAEARKRLQMKWKRTINSDGTISLEGISKKGKDNELGIKMSSEIKMYTPEECIRKTNEMKRSGELNQLMQYSIPLSDLSTKHNPLAEGILHRLNHDGDSGYTLSHINEVIQQSIKASGILDNSNYH